ncbi:undecaprenyl-phosphate glucose phosphotransferase [Thermosynechococcus sp. FA-CM-4201]
MNHLGTNASLITRITDGLAIAGLAVVDGWFLEQGTLAPPSFSVLLLSIMLFWLFAELWGAYQDLRIRPFWVEVRRISAAWLSTGLSLLVLGWIFKLTAAYSRLGMAFWFLLTLFLLGAGRYSIRQVLKIIRRKGKNRRRAVIIGAGCLGQRWLRTLHSHSHLGIDVLAFFDDAPALCNSLVEGIPVRGNTTAAAQFVAENKVDLVYLALPLRAEERLRQIMQQFHDSTATVYLLPNIFVFELLNLRLFQVDGIPLIALSESPLTAYNAFMKRLEDLILGTVALVLLAPVMLLIALLIKLDSPGSIFFRQTRYGLDGRPIKVWKFRTMTVCEDKGEIIQAKRNDQRITRIGKILRRTSLDELPQLFNVLKGEMSLVGPRPHATAHDEYYRQMIDHYIWRLKVKPGMTGWAQVNGWRGETDTVEKMQKRVEHDLFYIKNWSLSLDFCILWLTIWRGFIHKNAY